MKLYYSAATGEFYDSHIHQTLPDDAVEVTAQIHQVLLNAMAQGTRIGEPGNVLATRKYVDEAVQKNRGEIEKTVQEKYSGLRHMQVFDKDGEFTVPENCTRIKIRLWGGGGGGASETDSYVSISGAGGGYAEGFFTVVPGTTLNITVGAAGKAGDSRAEAGGTSKVGSLISATGGKSGDDHPYRLEESEAPPILGGVGQGGDWQVAGSPGESSREKVGRTGGAAYSSSGGLGRYGRGSPGMTPGGGGAGGGTDYEGKWCPGGDGGAGLVIIEY